MPMERKQQKHIIHQLKGKTFSNDLMVEIKASPKEAFNMLVDGIRSDEFTDYQYIHALHIMFELCARELLGFQDKLLEECIFLIKKINYSQFVSSSALVILVRMLISNKTSPKYYPIEQDLLDRAREIIREMNNYNLDDHSKEYARKCRERYSFC